MTTRWYCAQTNHRGELVAEQNLKAQGFEPFNPRYETNTISHGREQLTRRPLFPGYIFVPFDITESWWPKISNTRGVRRLMPEWMERPTPVRDDAMQVILDQCNGQVVKVAQFDRSLRMVLWPGALVKANDGPFEGFTGEVEWTDKDRVKALMFIFGRTTPVEFDRKQLEVIS